MKTQTMKLKIRGALKTWLSALTLVTFLFVQILPVSFAQEMVLEQQKLMPEQSAVANTQPEKPQVDNSSIAALQDAAKPLSLPVNQEKKNAEPEVRGLGEYSFNDALDQLQPGIASAVIVKKISASDLRKLSELKIEVGIAAVHGKIVLFTSGEEDQIRMLPAAKKLLEQASVIAHTHEHGGAMPSAEDFMEAGSQIEYVVSDKGIYAYNHDGLIYEKPLSFGYLVGKINAARKPNASTKETRDLLNEFIKSMDEYNSLQEQGVIFRSAAVLPGLPILITTASPNNFVSIDQYSTDHFRMNFNFAATGIVKASVNFVASQGPQNLSGFSTIFFDSSFPYTVSGFTTKVEFVDVNNVVASIPVSTTGFFSTINITQSQIRAAAPSLDLTRIKQIDFVVGNGYQGHWEIKIGGLSFNPPLSSDGFPIVSGVYYTDPSVPLSTLPGLPLWSTSTTNGGAITVSQMKTSSYHRLTTATNLPQSNSTAALQLDFLSPQNLGSQVVFRVYGAQAKQIKTEIIDATGKIASYYLNSSFLTQNFKLNFSTAPVGFDSTRIAQIRFFEDQSHTGTSSDLKVEIQGLGVVVGGSTYDATAINVLPGNSVLKAYGVNLGTITQNQTSSKVFNFSYTLPGNSDSVVSEISWGEFSGGIFQGVPGPCGNSSSVLVIAATGPAGKRLRVQFVDANNNSVDYYLYLTGSKQNYSISTNAGYLGAVDINRIAKIKFISEKSNMGSSGNVEIETAGLGAPIIPPSTTLTPNNIVPLPTNGVVQGSIVFPAVTFITPTGAIATGNMGDDRGHYFYYETKTAGWAGTGLTYDNFSTPAIETGDINGLSQLTFGIVRGNPTIGFATRVKFEIVDNLDRKAHVYLDGIGDVEKAWAISTSYFRNAGVDLTKVRVMYFIVEGQNQIGALQINRYPAGSVLPQANLTPANITILPGDPQKNHVAPAGADSSGAGTPRGMFLNYTTGTPGWAGGGFSYDNFSTATVETGDISQYQNLSFGLKGDPSQVKFEILDAFGHKTSIYLHSIRADVEQVWSISTQSIVSYGVDLTKIRWIYFIVEGQSQTGTVEINKVPAIAPSGSAITPLPGTPQVVRIAPAGVTANVSTISRGARLDYNTLTPGWAGVGFSFNDAATTATESVNLSSFSYLEFGLKGNATQVKFEVVDASGRKASLVLTGISPTSEQRWSIPTSMFFSCGIDLTHITGINFIVEGANQSGSLEIYRI